MIKVSAKADVKDLDRFIRKMDELKRGPRLLVNDLYKLGEAGYKYLKTIIPVSKSRKPHLRNHFKIKVERSGYGLILSIFPHPESQFFYAIFLDQGANVPTRFPRKRSAMRFVDNRSGDIVFTKKAKGFSTRGIHYVDRGERFLLNNVWNYVDPSLRRYLK